MMRGVFQEEQPLLHHFLLQEQLPVSGGMVMMMMKKTAKMKRIGFSLPPDLVVRQQGTLPLGEYVGSL